MAQESEWAEVESYDLPGSRVSVVIRRSPDGVAGLYEMLGGGFLPNQVVAVVGPPGGGKTIAMLQFLHANASLGRKCLLVSAADEEESIVTYSQTFGLDFQPFLQSGQMRIVTVRMMDAGSGLPTNILERLPGLISQSGAEVIGIDSITEFQDMCDSDMERKGRTIDLRWQIKATGATALIIAEAGGPPGISKYGIIEYVADGVVLQSRLTSEDGSETLHVVQVLKMRWLNHSKEIRAYRVTARGLEVLSPLYTALASSGKKRKDS
ncbi:MAG: ATPase domain-containing protein [Halobacteria archaeon]